jgi:hypothetical protein
MIQIAVFELLDDNHLELVSVQTGGTDPANQWQGDQTQAVDLEVTGEFGFTEDRDTKAVPRGQRIGGVHQRAVRGSQCRGNEGDYQIDR